MRITGENELFSATVTHNDRPSSGYDSVERRLKPRIQEPFFARVRGVDTDGRAFKVNTLVDNISASGLYMRLAAQVDPGAKLFIVIHLSASLSDQVFVGRVVALGVVLRCEPRSGKLWGLAIRFARYRFL